MAHPRLTGCTVALRKKAFLPKQRVATERWLCYRKKRPRPLVCWPETFLLVKEVAGTGFEPATSGL